MLKQQLQPGTQRPALERSEVKSGNHRHSWLLFVHQLPTRPTSLRVRTWRRLQQLGALTVKQAVYVLPDSPNAREDFEWLKTEIQVSGGEVSIFAANMVDTWSDDALVGEFRRSREQSYNEIARDVDQLLRRLSPRRRKGQSMPSRRGFQQLRERLAAVERIDFFGSAGRDRVLTLLRQLEDRVASPTKQAAAGASARA